MLTHALMQSLREVACFYDQRTVGNVGSLGFRRSSGLGRLLGCLTWLIDRSILVPGKTRFLDMGCGDGRVNVLLSYFVRVSVGVELDEWTLDEYLPLRTELDQTLKARHLSLPPKNITLLHGNSLDREVHEAIRRKSRTGFEEFDLFYTYLSMFEEFAAMIARKAKRGAVFMVYGLEKIQPSFEGLRLLTAERPLQKILSLYQRS
jgi:hypothetical protein